MTGVERWREPNLAWWTTSDVHDSVAAVDGRTFDLVYTGKGARCWLPDMTRWAGVMWELGRPDGQLYLSEFHPLRAVPRGA